MRYMLLGVYLLLAAVFWLLLCVAEVAPSFVAWLSFLLAIISLLVFLEGHCQTEKDDQNKEEDTTDKGENTK